MSEFEEEMGAKFEESRWEQRFFCKSMYAMAGVTAGMSGVNYFLAPDERITYTIAPLAGSIALCGLAKLYDRVQDSIQDKILEYGMKDFPNAMDDE